MNDSRYGLTASIWTADEATLHISRSAREAGTVYMNRCDYLDPALAWTGIRTAAGAHAFAVRLRPFTRLKSFHLGRSLKIGLLECDHSRIGFARSPAIIADVPALFARRAELVFRNFDVRVTASFRRRGTIATAISARGPGSRYETHDLMRIGKGLRAAAPGGRPALRRHLLRPSAARGIARRTRGQNRRRLGRGRSRAGNHANQTG